MYYSNSIVRLKDGRKIFCENEVPEIQEFIKNSNQNDILLLISSEENGNTFPVFGKDIVSCEYTD